MRSSSLLCVDFEVLGVVFSAVRGVDFDVGGFLVEFGNVGVDIITT